MLAMGGGGFDPPKAIAAAEAPARTAAVRTKAVTMVVDFISWGLTFIDLPKKHLPRRLV
jgi:hypothetical protein